MRKLEAARRANPEGEHCSSLVRVTQPHEHSGTPADVQLLFGHTTWESYAEMVRIYKHFDFGFKAAAASHRVSFSGYPGAISSLDDWFTLPDSKLLVMETALDSHFGDGAYKRKVGPDGILLAWVRVLLANRLAHSGREWAQIFAKHNSGTANCQWQIVDVGRFNKAKKVLEGTHGTDWSKVPKEAKEGILYVSEQHILDFVNTDASATLFLNSYYPGYNKPFLRPLVNYATDTYARARMFHRDQGAVNSLDALKVLLTQNKFSEDPLSDGHPMIAIAPRGDLSEGTSDHHLFGAIDCKVSSSSVFPDSEALMGPPHDARLLPPFSWDNHKLTSVVHLGQPVTFNFGFVKMSARGI